MPKITVELAQSPAELAHGLMYRQTLEPDSGMLFKFQNFQEVNFWGKNTYIPLDIAFVYNNEIMDIQHIAPMSTRMVNSACDLAIEVNAGYFSKNNIKVGNKIKIHQNEDKTEIEFI